MRQWRKLLMASLKSRSQLRECFGDMLTTLSSCIPEANTRTVEGPSFWVAVVSFFSSLFIYFHVYEIYWLGVYG